jgi:hypothetical protein
MKIRGFVLITVVAMIVLAAAIVWLGKTPPGAVGEMDATNLAGSIVRLTAPDNGHPTTSVVTSIGAVTRMSPDGDNKAQRVANILSSANDIPIVFYGKLVDQFTNPIAGAEIDGTTMIINGTTNGANRVTARSDSNGLFQLDGGNGQSLAIMPKKDGYGLATTRTLFNYSHLSDTYFVPDQQNPTVIKMWKLSGPEPLVSVHQELKVRPDESPINIDLLTGVLGSSGGDLRVLVVRPPGVVSLRNKQDWSFQIEAVDGGLIESSSAEARTTYAAPDTGYVPKETLVFSVNSSRGWLGGFDQMFFLTTRNGKIYGKMLVSFNLNRNPNDLASLTLSGIVNANGSRNLEGDANTMINSGQ